MVEFAKPLQRFKRKCPDCDQVFYTPMEKEEYCGCTTDKRLPPPKPVKVDSKNVLIEDYYYF